MKGEYTLKERYLAIVLLDLIGSTAFVQRYGALKAAKWFQYHDRLTRNLCIRFSGREIDRSDGFLMSFDRTIDAANFALSYQQIVPLKTGLNTRIGVHWGKVIEVTQDELWKAVGAKGVEIEGLSKNIAARTMSLCSAGQVLLTKDAMNHVRGRANAFTLKRSRYACVGMYKFKGVKEPKEIYALGVTIASLQPPKGNSKVKRLGGPKYIKSRARDRRIKEWFWWLSNRAAFVSMMYLLYVFYFIISTSILRGMLGLRYFAWIDSVNSFILRVFSVLIGG